MQEIKITNPDGSSIRVNTELADGLLSRMKGLMGRKSLGENEGMLFVFDRPGRYALWMFNTPIPLDAIYISENGTILEIIEMEPRGVNPFGCPNYNPQNESKYILEVNKELKRRRGGD